MEKLPVECLIQIMFYLDYIDIIRLSSLSKTLHLASKDPKVWEFCSKKRWKTWNWNRYHLDQLKLSNLKLSLKDNDEYKNGSFEVDKVQLSQWRELFIQRYTKDRIAKECVEGLVRSQSRFYVLYEKAANLGPDVIEKLEEIKETNLNLSKVYWANQIIYKILRNRSLKEWESLLNKKDISIEEGSYILCRSINPNFDERHITNQLDNFAKEVAPLLHGSLTQKIQQLLDYLFETKGFSGDLEHYDDSRNSFLDQVLIRKKGIPITLSILFSAVARRVGIIVNLVNFPMHLLTRVDLENGDFVLIDCYSAKFVTLDNCRNMIRREVTPEMIKSAAYKDIFIRQLNNLYRNYYSELPRDLSIPLNVIEQLIMLSSHNTIEIRLFRQKIIMLYNLLQEHASIKEDFSYIGSFPNTKIQPVIQTKIEEAEKESLEVRPRKGISPKFSIGQVVTYVHNRRKGVVSGWHTLEERVVYSVTFDQYSITGTTEIFESCPQPLLQVNSPEVGKYFESFSSELGYTPNEGMRKLYPDD